jgi:hypothetical protein
LLEHERSKNVTINKSIDEKYGQISAGISKYEAIVHERLSVKESPVVSSHYGASKDYDG